MTARTKVPAPDTTPAAPSPALDELTGSMPRLVELATGSVFPHPANPRREVGDIDDLAADIKAHGILAPLVVVPIDDRPGEYFALAGNRRHAAATSAGVATVPAIVRADLTLAQQRALMVRENVHRADLTVTEEADAYWAMLDIDGLKVADIAKAVSRSAAHVRDRVKIAGLPERGRAALDRGGLTIEQALRVAALPEAAQQAVYAAVGSADLGWRLAQVERQAETARVVERLTPVLEASGATSAKFHPWDLPDGYRLHGDWLVHTEAAYAKIVESGVLTEITTGWLWNITSADRLVVARPVTLDEAAADATKAAPVKLDEAEVARREAEAATERAHEEFLAATATTRKAVIDRVIAARAVPTKALPALATVAGIFLTDYHTSTWGIASRDRLIVTAGGEKPDTALHYTEYQAACRVRYADTVLTLPGPVRLVVALAAAIEPVGADEWLLERARPGLVAWFDLMDALGYVAPDGEVELLASTPWLDDEPADEAEGAGDDESEGDDDLVGEDDEYFDEDES